MHLIHLHTSNKFRSKNCSNQNTKFYKSLSFNFDCWILHGFVDNDDDAKYILRRLLYLYHDFR